jgi:hypothetical protein
MEGSSQELCLQPSAFPSGHCPSVLPRVIQPALTRSMWLRSVYFPFPFPSNRGIFSPPGQTETANITPACQRESNGLTSVTGTGVVPSP